MPWDYLVRALDRAPLTAIAESVTKPFDRLLTAADQIRCVFMEYCDACASSKRKET